ncbi:WXG100 family type VII secretion target [Nocardia amamiensis]|uniref:WXG100 family type VII secretion target n=1 Tax=Nocardia amamiensis TaxID=404578 RepID=UPI000835BB24|nr:WXG100 family type VII secretion target [Nocardia amamiensis]
MGEQFALDPDRLRAHAPAFEQIGADVAATVRRLHDALSKEGTPWGDDDAGRAFAESYVPESKQTMSNLNSLVEVLQQAGGDLRNLAANFENQDLALGQRVRNAGNAIQNGSTSLPVSDNTVTQQLGPSRTTPATVAQPHSELPADATPTTPQPTHQSPSPAPATQRSPDASKAPADTQDPTEGGPADTRKPTMDGPSTEQQPGQLNRNPTDRDQPGTDHQGVPGPSVNPFRQMAAEPVRPAQNAPAASPWTRPTPRATNAAAPATSTPWSQAASSHPPRVSAPEAGTPGSPPRMPGRPARPEQKPEQTNVNGSGESVAARLARELAEWHGVHAFGFDTPDVPEQVLTEIVAAVDDVLPQYPQIAVHAIGIDELPDGETTLLEWHAANNLENSDSAQESDAIVEPSGERPLMTARIVLAVHAATDSKRMEQTITAADSAGLLAPGCARRPVYSSIVRELGGALDGAGGFGARAAAQRALLTAYLPQLNPEDKGSLNRTVSGFQEWRSQLSGRSFRRGRFQPADALAEAFTDVVLNGAQAAPPAQVLYRLLVTTARSAGPHADRQGRPARS